MKDSIDKGKRKEGSIGNLLEGYLSKFVVHESAHLFDLDDEFKLIRQGICPICLCNLKVSQKGDVFCNSKKHLSISKKKLFITKKGFEKFSTASPL